MHNTKIRFRKLFKEYSRVYKERTHTTKIGRSMLLLSDHPFHPYSTDTIRFGTMPSNTTNTFTLLQGRKREFSYRRNSKVTHLGTRYTIPCFIWYPYRRRLLVCIWYCLFNNTKISLWCDTVESHNKCGEEHKENG